MCFNGVMTNTDTFTHTHSGVRIGAVVFNAAKPNDPRWAYRSVSGNISEAYDLADDEFLVLSYAGYITVGKLTGRTRRCWGISCPTIERYEIETYATDDGRIMGRKADRIEGIAAVRPENVQGR